jgi:cytochrome c peroxidase
MKPTFKKLRASFLLFSIGFMVILFACISCGKKEWTAPEHNSGLKPTPTNPWLPSKAYEYPVGGNNDLATLGRVLFYDKNLSLDKSVSCGSCHQQGHGFADSKQFSTGFNGAQTARNTHVIINADNSRFWDGKNQTQFGGPMVTTCTGSYNTTTCTNSLPNTVFKNPVSIPFLSSSELNMADMTVLTNRVAAQPYYTYLFQKAFSTLHPDFTEENIEMALGTFMDNITSTNCKFDQMKSGKIQLTPEEQDGMNIFNGKAKCNLCHHETNSFAGVAGQFEDIGLDVNYTDLGRGTVTSSAIDNGRFHVPSLKNIGLTAPYMHDGRFATLNDVVDFFDGGVKNSPNLSSALSIHAVSDGNGGFMPVTSGVTAQPLNLTSTEKLHLVAFLNTFSDLTLANDIRFSDPFKH